MPLIGLILPDHKERASDEPGRYPKWLPVEDVLAIAETADPKWSPWPYEMIAAAVLAHQERDYISVTMLTGGCPRGNVLERRENYVMSLDGVYASLRGTQIHRTLEQAARPNSIAEARFFTTLYTPVGDTELSCSPDQITKDGTMLDWKVTANPPTFGYPYRSHTLQLQFNRWVVNHAEQWTLRPEDVEKDIPINPRTLQFQHLAVVYLGDKGPKVIELEKSVEVKLKNATVKRKQPDVWSDDQVEAELRPRFEWMAMALEMYPEWPPELEEVWGGKPDWKCPGPPLCFLPRCLAKSYPDGLTWEAAA